MPPTTVTNSRGEIGCAHADEHWTLVVESDGVPLHAADALAVMHLAASTVELCVHLQPGDENASADWQAVVSLTALTCGNVFVRSGSNSRRRPEEL
jgi:hypothetical protein